MTPKEWLQSYQRNQQEIKAREEALAQIRASAANVTAQLGKNGGSGTKDPHKYDYYCIRIEEQMAELKRIYRQQRKIERAIDKLQSPTQKAVLTYLYICGHSINATAEEMHYDRHSIQRIRNRALTHITVK